jgi:hypothetical protein
MYEYYTNTCHVVTLSETGNATRQWDYVTKIKKIILHVGQKHTLKVELRMIFTDGRRINKII